MAAATAALPALTEHEESQDRHLRQRVGRRGAARTRSELPAANLGWVTSPSPGRGCCWPLRSRPGTRTRRFHGQRCSCSAPQASGWEGSDEGL